MSLIATHNNPESRSRVYAPIITAKTGNCTILRGPRVSPSAPCTRIYVAYTYQGQIAVVLYPRGALEPWTHNISHFRWHCSVRAVVAEFRRGTIEISAERAAPRGYRCTSRRSKTQARSTMGGKRGDTRPKEISCFFFPWFTALTTPVTDNSLHLRRTGRTMVQVDNGVYQSVVCSSRAR